MSASQPNDEMNSTSAPLQEALSSTVQPLPPRSRTRSFTSLRSLLQTKNDEHSRSWRIPSRRSLLQTTNEETNETNNTSAPLQEASPPGSRSRSFGSLRSLMMMQTTNEEQSRSWRISMRRSLLQTTNEETNETNNTSAPLPEPLSSRKSFPSLRSLLMQTTNDETNDNNNASSRSSWRLPRRRRSSKKSTDNNDDVPSSIEPSSELLSNSTSMHNSSSAHQRGQRLSDLSLSSSRQSWSSTQSPHQRLSSSSLQSRLSSRRLLGPEVNMIQSSLQGSTKKRMDEVLALGSFTLHKLDFDKGLFGRQEEEDKLQDCLNQLTAGPSPASGGPNNDIRRSRRHKKQIILIGGISGTGKTSLAATLEPSVKRLGGVFVRGKYERHNACQAKLNLGLPLSGIGMACQELCRLALGNKERLARVKLELEQHLDCNLLALLESAIPGTLLSTILSESSRGLPSVAESKSSGGSLGSAELTISGHLKQPPPTRLSATRNKRKERRASIQRIIRSAGRLVTTPEQSLNGDHGSTSSHKSKKNEQDNYSINSFSSSRSANNLRLLQTPTESKQLVIFAIRTFLRITCMSLGPVVMVLDDLQWADKMSLEVVEAVAKDPAISHLLLIGTYRSDEVEQSDHNNLGDTLDALQQEDANGNKLSYGLTTIALDVLSFEAVTDWIMELLNVSSAEKAQELSSICIKRTMGNPFFIKVFLQMLQEGGFLEFNIGMMKWTWDSNKIESDTVATDNVVTLIMDTRMRQYSKEMLLLLQIAACQGSSFDSRTIGLVWSHLHHGAAYERDTTVPELLEVAVREMLIEPVTTGNDRSYRFIHDKVLEAATSLDPPEIFNELRNKVGQCLLQGLTEEELETRLFVVVDNLNNGANCNAEIADLNARAAEKAKDLAAFSSASQYVEFGIMSLNGIDMWATCPYLALRLYSIGAEVEEWAGNRANSDWYCKEVQRQKALPVIHTMRVNKIAIERLYSEGQYDDLWRSCFELLGKLGCSLPKNRRLQKLKGTWYLQETKRFLPTADDVYGMPIITEPRKLEALALMVRAASFALATKNKPLYILLCCKCVRWTKKHGLTAHTASALASFANVLMHQDNDWATATRIASMALAIEKRMGSNYTKTSTLHKSNSFVLGWVNPLRTCRLDYLEAYKLGMLSGNVEAVGMTVLFLLASEFFSGGSTLQSLDDDLQNYIPQLELLGLHSYVLGLRMLRQKVLNLIGAPYNPQTTLLTGTAMHGMEPDKHPFIYNTVGKHHICNMCAYFAEYEQGAEIALSMGESFYSTFLGASYFGFEPFSRAICLYSMAVKTGEAKYLKAAQEARQTIATWVSHGAINLVHHSLILCAEDAVARGNNNHEKVKKLYVKAIAAAVKGGFLPDAGLANERFALYLVAEGNYSDGSFHMKEAIRYYSEWGAGRKVTKLEEEHEDLLGSNVPLDSYGCRVQPY